MVNNDCEHLFKNAKYNIKIQIFSYVCEVCCFLLLHSYMNPVHHTQQCLWHLVSDSKRNMEIIPSINRYEMRKQEMKSNVIILKSVDNDTVTMSTQTSSSSSNNTFSAID